MLLAQSCLHMLASCEPELQIWQEKLKTIHQFERKKEHNMNAKQSKHVVPFCPVSSVSLIPCGFIIFHVFLVACLCLQIPAWCWVWLCVDRCRRDWKLMRAKQISKNAFDASRVARAYCEGTRVVLEAAIIAHESRYNHVRIQVSDPPPSLQWPKKTR
jgi:hypothetical protein